MQFYYPIEVEPNTTADSPERLKIKLCVGTLKKIMIYFPWGCGGQVGVRILHYEHQLYPTNLDEWRTGSSIMVEFESNYLIAEGPSEFKIEAYNEDDFYVHTPIVSFNVLREGEAFYSIPGWVEG